jgi:hypothetical protein
MLIHRNAQLNDMEIRIDADSILGNPFLHDALLETLSVGKDKSAFIDCRDANGRVFRIRFTGVRVLEGNDFRQGNIIGTIWCYHGERIPPNDAVRLVFGDQADSGNICKFLAELHRSNQFLVHIWCSYGAEIKLLCQDVSWENITV